MNACKVVIYLLPKHTTLTQSSEFQMLLFSLSLSFIAQSYLWTGSLADNVPLGGTCNQNFTRIDPASKKLLSDCDDNFFCDTNSTCQYRGCRRFDQDIVYQPGDLIPPFCPRGSYCPDIQDECKALIPIGESCELDRDGALTCGLMLCRSGYSISDDLGRFSHSFR